MQVKKLKFSEVSVAEYNPRVALTPEDAEYKQIAASLERFGLVVPLVFNERTGRLVGGHQRLQILKDMGKRSAEFMVVDLSEDEERALNVALNRRGHWDRDALSAVLKDIGSGDLLAATGYTPLDVRGMVEAATAGDFLGGISIDTEAAAAQHPARPSAAQVHQRSKVIRFMLTHDELLEVESVLSQYGGGNDSLLRLVRERASL